MATDEVISIDSSYDVVIRYACAGKCDPVFALDPGTLAARDKEYWRRHEAICADIANPQQQETQQQ
jgi:hypothetical protein